jgi:glycosyltransferase involved in cell wall biosynthesis
VDPKGHILTNDSVLSRHVEYGRELNRITQGEMKLGVIKPTLRVSTDQLYEGIEVKHFPIIKLLSPKHFLRSSIFSSEKEPSLLIAGDPWFAGILALLISRKLQTKNKVQIQLHGDFGNPVWIYASLRNRIKYALAKVTAKHASQVRCVSNIQAQFISKSFKLDFKKLTISPVPMMLWNKTPTLRNSISRVPVIGLVGRLQFDRGLNLFIDLIGRLQKEHKEFEVQIIGSGREQAWLQKQFDDKFPQIKVEFVGEVSQNDMPAYWERLDLLISCAPTESYGRAVRESIFAGVPVLATASSGVLSMNEAIQNGYIRLYDRNTQSWELAEVFEQLLEIELPMEFRENLAREDQAGLRKIIDQWISLSA